MSDIKAGYALEVTTWENDGDCYNTVRFDGLVKDEAEFFLRVARLFTSDGSGRAKPGYGNYGNRDDATPDDEIRAIVQEYIDQGKKIPKWWNPAEWRDGGVPLEEAEFSDSLWDLIGTGYECGNWRVFESAAIYYYPSPVVDVVAEFN